MKQLIEGIIFTLVAQISEYGSLPPGTFGPYWDEAPEKVNGEKPGYPRIVLTQMPSRPIDWYWPLTTSPYAEYAKIEVKVYATDMVSAADIADDICRVLDNNRFSLVSDGTDLIRAAMREGAPMMKKESSYDTVAGPVFSGTMIYNYTTQRGN